MEPEIKNRFDQHALDDALSRFGVAPDQARALDGFESFIYEVSRDGRDFILRIGHSRRRSEQLILGEVDWINYLYRGGVTVARAVPSEDGRLVEAIPDGQGEAFLATAFAKAPGGPPKRGIWDDGALVEGYGRLLGRMNTLSQSYEPPEPTWRRPSWDDPFITDMAAWLPPSEAEVLARYVSLRNRLRALPRDNQSYGLIHQDAHAGNFYVDEQGTITLFDFDDCVYSWYVDDIAIVLFYAALFQEEPAAFAARFLLHFLRGYFSDHKLNPAWLARIPDFLKLRELELYGVIHRSFDVNELKDPWVRGFMDGRRERIVAERPVLDLNFDALAAAYGAP